MHQTKNAFKPTSATSTKSATAPFLQGVGEDFSGASQPYVYVSNLAGRICCTSEEYILAKQHWQTYIRVQTWRALDHSSSSALLALCSSSRPGPCQEMVGLGLGVVYIFSNGRRTEGENLLYFQDSLGTARGQGEEGTRGRAECIRLIFLNKSEAELEEWEKGEGGREGREGSLKANPLSRITMNRIF